MYCIEKGLTYAIIPARSGSQSVKNKNIQELNGHPLLAYSIAVAKLVPEISRVIVTTDSVKYAEIAIRYGAEAPFLRPKEISGHPATDLQFMQHAIEWLIAHEKLTPEYWVHLRPTTPLRNPEAIQKALHQIKQDNTADSLRSAHPTEACPFKWFWIQDETYFTTFNHITLDQANYPRQSFPQAYIPDGYVDILKTECICRKGKIHGDKMLAYISPQVVDVDHIHDLEVLHQTVGAFNSPIIQYLKQFE